ncbi:MAG: hypothetical protein LQ340_003763 [Diploschistes diacapsis]|nr:MAG: hypothetical protein LQ340_003763 [Diploschistes diacapsis]
MLMYPIFISDLDDEETAIPSLPGQHRRSVSKVLPHLEPLIRKGLQSVVLFGVLVKDGAKNPTGTGADDENGPVIRTIELLRSKAPSLFIIADVCLCEYTSHGHCGILHEDGSLINTASIDRLSDVALAYARAGAHCMAPSDRMMDGCGLSN